MKNKNILATVVVILFLVGLVGSNFIQQIIHQQPIPTPVPVASPNAPKTFNFDSSTDLKMELQKVNPQVLDSDFE